jgi:hypothetical protein
MLLLRPHIFISFHIPTLLTPHHERQRLFLMTGCPYQQ